MNIYGQYYNLFLVKLECVFYSIYFMIRSSFRSIIRDIRSIVAGYFSRLLPPTDCWFLCDKNLVALAMFKLATDKGAPRSESDVSLLCYLTIKLAFD